MYFDWSAPLSNSGLLLQGLSVTLQVSIISFICAFVLGLLGALGRRSHLAPVRFLATAYVEAIRNTPVLLQIFVVYYGLPEIGLRFNGMTAGIVALSINSGAYLTEIIRAGIQSVSRGQVEAATALALSPGQTFRYIVFPQALRNIYPPVINQFIMILLGSSLLSAIAVSDLMGTAMIINSSTLRTVETFSVALVLYLILTNFASFVLGLFGRVLFPTPTTQRRTFSVLFKKVSTS